LGGIKWRYEYDWAGGEADIKKAIEFNPNNGAFRSALAFLLYSKRQFDKGYPENLASVELDPFSANRHSIFAYLLYFSRRYDEALAHCKKTIELNPDYPFTYIALGLCYIQKSLFPESIAALQKAVALSGNSTENLALLAYGYVKSGNHEKALEIIKELDKLSVRSYVSKYFLASIQAALGDKDNAFKSLESAYKERDLDLIFLMIDPKFDILRSDPRYEMMLKKIGLEK
jgi:tetratricopeptide (TPR) repeat protein